MAATGTKALIAEAVSPGRPAANTFAFSSQMVEALEVGRVYMSWRGRCSAALGLST